MIEKFDKVDESFVCENKSWFKLSTIKVDKIVGGKISSLDGSIKFCNCSFPSSSDIRGFNYFDRGNEVEIPIAYANKPNRNKSVVYLKEDEDIDVFKMSADEQPVIKISNGDINIGTKSIRGISNTVEGLDMIVNDLNNKLLSLEEKVDNFIKDNRKKE